MGAYIIRKLIGFLGLIILFFLLYLTLETKQLNQTKPIKISKIDSMILDIQTIEFKDWNASQPYKDSLLKQSLKGVKFYE